MKAMVLAGGLPQIALINEIKSRGIFVVLLDYFPNPVAKPYADTFYQVSTLDIQAVTEIAKKECVDFVVTVCTDQALLTVAKVSEDLGLPCYIDYQTALNVTNKSFMKRVFAEKDISSARFVVMDDFDIEKVSNLRFPLIVKPVDCNSSKGVRRVENMCELREAFTDARQLSRTNNVIVEEYVDGVELSIDVYVENGEAHVLSISQLDKLPDKDKFVIFRSKTPESLTDIARQNVQIAAQQIAEAFHIRNAPMLIQAISDGSKVYVLEFSARTGGGEKFVMIKRLSGFDVIKAVVDLTLGEVPHLEKICTNTPYFASEFIYCENGVFDQIVGADELLTSGVLSDFYQFKTSGMTVGGARNSGDRAAGYSIVADTRENLEYKHNVTVNTLKVLDIKGNNIMRYDLLPKIFCD